jgi:cytochrome c oxidase subunit II
VSNLARPVNTLPDAMDPTSLLRRAIAPALLALLISAVPASAGLILPEAGPTQNAQDTRTLYAIILVLAVIVFVGVEGVLFYCLFKYRARKGRVAAQIHGNTRLEIGWTVGAAVILVFLTIATFVMLPGIKNPAASDIDANGNPVAANAAFAATDQEAPPKGESMNIKVDGMQYVWQYTYPNNGDKPVFAYTDMYVPVGMTITLEIGSNDVQHSWWIPKLGGKMDALPGYTNKTWFKVTEPGEFAGQCAELCGRNHANMYARVIALPFDEWKAWYDRQASDLEAAKQAAAEGRQRLEEQKGDEAVSGGGGAGTGTSDSDDSAPE